MKNRCPSGFQTAVEQKFKISGGIYIEVSNNYRASQYDHTVDDYIKKRRLVCPQCNKVVTEENPSTEKSHSRLSQTSEMKIMN